MTVGPIPIPVHLKLPSHGRGFLRQIRRTWRSRKALKGTSQWIIDWCLPMAAALFALYLFAVRTASPGGVYRTLTLIDPPKHLPLWLASLVGWLLVPAILGGFAGHVIAQRISRVKSVSTRTLFRRRPMGQRLRPPGLIDDLVPYFHGSYGEQDFVDAWVRVAHRNDWARAQDHWEVFVRDMMSTQQYAHLDRHECLRQVRNASLITLKISGRSGLCIVCEKRR
ncbi:DUF6313 family protein [Kitasatospora sp. NPDC057223]|uniref:DUF6313 family protein n=1 Tax=Kitasatospora sp. NPDC057223 TaxID=3346055 RepID=UPI003632E904